jgi:hypothetical protein
MTRRSWGLRILRVIGLAAVAGVLLAFILIQFEQRLLRHRAERLMADMHQIHLYQSTWEDAQKLMHRWGAWGRWEGTCTAADCQYEITLTDPSWTGAHPRASAVIDWFLSHHRFDLYSRLGGRAVRLAVSFRIHDGTIWRKSASLDIFVPPGSREMESEYGYTLIVITKSRQVLRNTENDWWIMGGDDELAEHPYYKAGRPGGCEICEEAVVTYSTRTPPAEIERLTSFDFSCLTRFQPCTDPAQLLPAAKGWHLYQYDESYPHLQSSSSRSQPEPCDIPLWALARDQNSILIADALSTSIKGDKDWAHEVARIKVVAYLKAPLVWPVGTILEVAPFSGNFINPPFQAAEHLVSGRRYILLPMEDGHGKPERYDDSSIPIIRCGVREDTSEARREVEKGLGQHDTLRGPELR